MNENEIFKTLDAFEAGLPTDCSGCETIHRVQSFVTALADRFDARCNDFCDSQCVYAEKREGGEATA